MKSLPSVFKLESKDIGFTQRPQLNKVKVKFESHEHKQLNLKRILSTLADSDKKPELRNADLPY